MALFVFFQITETQIANNKTLGVSAYISDQNNKEISNGKCKMRFAIYNVEKGGSSLWQKTQEVELNNGIFNAFLGAVNPLPESFDFSEGNYFLGIRVEDDEVGKPIINDGKTIIIKTKAVDENSKFL